MRRLILAIQFLTRLPLPAIPATSADFAASMRWFPVVGLLIGGLVAGIGLAAAHVDPWTGALAALLCWVGVTGGLHLDGLADIADAAGAAHKGRDRVAAALADPHVGSFGVVAVALQLIAKLVLLHGLLARGILLPFLLVPAAARIAPLAWTRWLPQLHQGLGAHFAGAIGRRHLLFWIAMLAAGAWWSPALVLTPLLALGWGRWLRKRIGGISGDGHGAGIEVLESMLLAASLAWSALA